MWTSPPSSRVADDGGSSGRVRAELGIAPPGDVRNCLVALAERRHLAEVFDYRFKGGVDLRDHSVGNIIIAALVDMSGGFCEGVEQAGRFLRIKDRVDVPPEERRREGERSDPSSPTMHRPLVVRRGSPARRLARVRFAP
jgi:uncharacterized cofD-like protein